MKPPAAERDAGGVLSAGAGRRSEVLRSSSDVRVATGAADRVELWVWRLRGSRARRVEVFWEGMMFSCPHDGGRMIAG
jgi:hypothetical protein